MVVRVSSTAKIAASYSFRRCHYKQGAGVGQGGDLKKRTEVTIETERLLVIRNRPRMVMWCEQCRVEVRMLTVDQAALMMKIRSLMIYRLVETGDLHFAENDEGILLVCLNSLEAISHLSKASPFRLVLREEGD